MDAVPLSRPLRFLALAALAPFAALARAQVFPDYVRVDAGTVAPLSALKGLYAVDNNRYSLTTASEQGSGNQVGAVFGTFAIPAGTVSAVLHLTMTVPVAGCVLQTYVYGAGANCEDIGTRPVPSGTGTQEFAIPGDQLARFRDASTGETRIQFRLFRPPSAGSGAFGWSVDQACVLLPILPDGGYDVEGSAGQGTLASLFAVDGSRYVKTTAHEDGTNNQKASFVASFKIPAGTPSATLHAVTGTDLDRSILQTYLLRPNDGGVDDIDSGSLAQGQAAMDFLVTGTQLAQDRDASTGETLLQLRMFRPPLSPGDTNTSAVTWSTDQFVVYPAPSNGPALPTGLTAGAVSSSRIDLSWMDNANNEAGYVIERKGGADADFVQVGTANADATAYHDSGLTSSTAYTYRIKATNSSGDSPYSNQAGATTQAAPPPPPPYLKLVQIDTDIVLAGASTTAVIQLSAPASTATTVALSTSSNGISAPASVVIPAGSQTTTVSVDTVNTGAVAVSYLYAKSGSWEQKAKVVCAPSITSLGSVNASVTPGQGGMWISWSGPQDDIYGNSAIGYRVFRKNGSGSFSILGSGAGVGQSYVDTTTVAGTSYTYRVSLVDKNGVPVVSSQEVTASSSGGNAALSWQSPPTGTTQGTVNLSLSNSTDQETFVLYVDGTPFGVANSADTEGGSSGTLYASIDTTTLTNGQHTVWVSSEIDPDQAVYYTSTPISIAVSNSVNQSYNDGTTVIETNEHCEIRARTDASPYTLTITDQGGNTVRTWSGYGPEVRICWDGNASNGSYAGDGEFNVEISTGDPGSHYYSKVQGNSWRPTFLAMVTVTPKFYPEEQVAYAAHIRSNLQRLSQSGSSIASRYLVMTASEGTPIARSWVPKIQKWLKTTVQGLYLDGHGKRPPAGQTSHTVEFGDLLIHNYAGHSAGADIYIPTLLNGRRYKFVYLDTCHSIGGNKSSSPSDPWHTYMTTQPHMRWVQAFNIDLSDGVFLGNNGQVFFNAPPIGPGGGVGVYWRAYHYNFWNALGGSVQDTFYVSVAGLPSYATEPNPRSQWNYNGSIYYKTYCAGDYSF